MMTSTITPQTKGAIALQAPNLVQLPTTHVRFTIPANDTPTITLTVIHPSSVTEGSTVTLTLMTTNTSSQDIMVLASAQKTDPRITALPTTLTITANTTSTQTIIAIEDNDTPDKAQDYIIRLMLKAGIATLSQNTAHFTIAADNDLYYIGFTPSQLTLEEGTTMQAAITITPPPVQDITLMLASQDTQELTVSPTHVTFTANTSSTQVIIAAIADVQQESTEVYQVSIAVASNTPATTTPLVVTIPSSEAPAISAQLGQSTIDEGDDEPP